MPATAYVAHRYDLASASKLVQYDNRWASQRSTVGMRSLKEPKNRNSRIRWTREEVERVLERCAELKRLHPEWSAKRTAGEGQDVLSPSRRRPVYPPLVAWMNKQLAGWGSGSRGSRSEAIEEPAQAHSPVKERTSSRTGATGRDPIVDALIEYGIRAGSSVVVGILRDPVVQKSISELVADILRASNSLAKIDSVEDTQREAEGPQEILLVGVTDDQSKEFARTYRDVLALQFDKGTAITSGLRAAAARADIIISLERAVSSEVSRLLQQVNPDYIRHTSGIAQLRQRLAELALSNESGAKIRGRPPGFDSPARRRS